MTFKCYIPKIWSYRFATRQQSEIHLLRCCDCQVGKVLKISFSGIPNSSGPLPCLTAWAHFCFAMVLPMWTTSSPNEVWKQSHSCSCKGCKATNHAGTLLNLPNPEPSASCLWNLHGTLRNLPEVASGTYTSTHRNPPEPSDLPPEPTPAHTGTLRNLLQVASGTYMEPYTGTLRNLPEVASGTYTSAHRNSPEPSGTFLRNLLLRPAPAHTGAYLGWRPH